VIHTEQSETVSLLITDRAGDITNTVEDCIKMRLEDGSLRDHDLSTIAAGLDRQTVAQVDLTIRT
jgi:hypothetical protein